MESQIIQSARAKLASVNYANVGRVASMIGGGALAAYGLVSGVKHRSMSGAALALFGGGMVFKAASETLDAKHTAASHLPYRGGVVVEKSISIAKPAAELFAFWQNFENLPCFMENLISVKVIDERISHWSAKGPAGIPIEWDAETINEIPGEMIAWRSLESANIDNAGSVHFKPSPNGATTVQIVVRYDPPGHHAGAALAKLFGEEPALQVEEDLRRFKQLMETGEVMTKKPESTVKTSAKDMQWPDGQNPVKDHVAEASEDSFPASDPPSRW